MCVSVMSNQSPCADHVVACELSTAELICEEVIKVIGAFYGRNDRTTCIYGRPNKQIEKVTCLSTTATSTVAKSCDGKRRCTVYAVNSKFGDPCYGTFKYLELAYTCECKQRFLQCGFSLLEFTLIGAFYGRADRTTCIYGRPDRKFNKIDCFTRTANRVVAERCNSKSRCSIYAVNSIFSDPCPETYKYIQTTYTCLPARESCHSVKYCNTGPPCV
uniref:SUEL-type lectin domain-containing protein n=1 Tax=Gadus morhua TaxID=8049 RepID=A0A8C5AM67_GADMO